MHISPLHTDVSQIASLQREMHANLGFAIKRGILMLDVAIGMALIYLLFSGLVSGIQEVVAQLLALRGSS